MPSDALLCLVSGTARPSRKHQDRLVARGKRRYNVGFHTQGKTDMADGIVDIPLPGSIPSPNGENGAAAACHFLVGPENRLVEVAVRSVIEELDVGYSPLVLHGPSGVGKSHLARGLAEAWKARLRRDRVVVTTGVDFARGLADAIESQSLEEFRAAYRTANMLVFEDLGQLAVRRQEKLSAQEELVFTLDALLADRRWIVVTAAAAPAELPGLLPALQSRLSAGLSLPLVPPEAATRRALLRRLTDSNDISMPEPILGALADGLRGTAPQLAGAVGELSARFRLDGRQMDLPAVDRFLTMHNHKRQPSLHEIALATAHYFSIKLSELRSPVRRRVLVAARSVAVYLARQVAGLSLQEIGRYFGGRDHTTILHSFRQAEKFLQTDPLVHQAIEHLRKALWKT